MIPTQDIVRKGKVVDVTRISNRWFNRVSSRELATSNAGTFFVESLDFSESWLTLLVLPTYRSESKKSVNYQTCAPIEVRAGYRDNGDVVCDLTSSQASGVSIEFTADEISAGVEAWQISQRLLAEWREGSVLALDWAEDEPDYSHLLLEMLKSVATGAHSKLK